MLSLKSLALQHTNSPSTSILDLPSEILDAIIISLYASGGSQTRTILSVSLTCRKLRQSAYPILLDRVYILEKEQKISKRTVAIFQHLFAYPSLLACVRYLEFHEPTDDANRARSKSNELDRATPHTVILQCLPLMVGLRGVKCNDISDLTIQILTSLRNTPRLSVTLDLGCLERGFATTNLQALYDLTVATSNWRLNLIVPSVAVLPDPGLLSDLISNAEHVKSLGLFGHHEVVKDVASRKPAEQSHLLQHIQELHVSSRLYDAFEELVSDSFVRWEGIKRLRIHGDQMITQLLPLISHRFVSLESLRLQATTTNAFHENCTAQRPRRVPASFSYAELKSLRHLELDGCCTHVEISSIASPRLVSLRLQIFEIYGRIEDFDLVRPPSDIKWLAENCPDLEELELHVGDLENLWNPTAIPNVDVGVNTYRFLHYLTQITKLKVLRLFPHYIPRSGTSHRFNARQPLSDEQAVRVFQFLHRQRPSLQMLAITANFDYDVRGFAPMSWTVRDIGNHKTLLITRQAGKDYELEQIWVGERRMTTKTRTYKFHKPYLPDLEEWTIPITYPYTRSTTLM